VKLRQVTKVQLGTPLRLQTTAAQLTSHKRKLRQSMPDSSNAAITPRLKHNSDFITKSRYNCGVT